jgi:hypothetical protein
MRARSSLIWKTPASSCVSRPTSSRGSFGPLSFSRISCRSPGPILLAQPAQVTRWVNLKSSSLDIHLLSYMTYEYKRKAKKNKWKVKNYPETEVDTRMITLIE